ncbi:MAG: hypothetical protein LBH16_00175 [Treponema sp.]|jgi:hypothetical protein|nr:hypothetical protein [Treponema sp.]
MLIIDGILENGVFIPNKPLVDIKGRQSATLTVSTNDEIDRQEQILAWKQFGEVVLNSNEELEGNPERIKFKDIKEVI